MIVPVENRAKRLHAVLIKEGRAADSLLEVFTPGALQWPSEGIVMRPRHGAEVGIVQAWPERRDGSIIVDIAPSEELLTRWKAGARNCSVEFHALAESRTRRGVRQIDRALLVGGALTSRPAYSDTPAEYRRDDALHQYMLWL